MYPRYWPFYNVALTNRITWFEHSFRDKYNHILRLNWHFLILKAARWHDGVRGWLRPVQEDLQRGLLQAGPHRQDAGEVDRGGESGWPRVYHQEWRGEPLFVVETVRHTHVNALACTAGNMWTFNCNVVQRDCNACGNNGEFSIAMTQRPGQYISVLYWNCLGTFQKWETHCFVTLKGPYLKWNWTECIIYKIK